MYYQNTSEYGYVEDFRQQQFQNLVGQLFTIPQPVTLPNGQTLQAGTRVFIHRVTFTQTGQEMVTIVFPSGIGGNAVVGVTQVSGSQLSGAPVQFLLPQGQGQGQGFQGQWQRGYSY
ncbi:MULTISPECIES: hypothetical protein [Bacillus cereus group]|uniref:hypothetical protein n=1 Tax=Bacillus cereus group TaxID=86661 RepID=UPI000994A936|nr:MULTISPECIES: hypothetical protein [Bacillus cereus group]OPA36844.1 hypothetical protein BHL07_23470 [Bacillus cereus]QFQ28390.1 hypothetical protein DDE73_16930 [Bacillus thuringiensis]